MDEIVERGLVRRRKGGVRMYLDKRYKDEPTSTVTCDDAGDVGDVGDVDVVMDGIVLLFHYFNGVCVSFFSLISHAALGRNKTRTCCGIAIHRFCL